MAYPRKHGLYNPKYERDACGIGFVVNIKGEKSNQIVKMALESLVCLDHRGARGAEDNTGDGAGILMQIPHRFFEHACNGVGIDIPDPRHYGVGMIFMTDHEDRSIRQRTRQIIEDIVKEEGQKVLGWRKVPTDNFYLGLTSRACEPVVWQIFIGRSADLPDPMAFERKLYVIRKRATNTIRYAGHDENFYIPSLSSRTIVYKGMLTPMQVPEFYPDLQDHRMEAAIVLVHSRFSTNTFPSWERSHPYRYLIHNGEINTLRGNQNWMKTRQAMLASELWATTYKKYLPYSTKTARIPQSLTTVLNFCLYLAAQWRTQPS